MEQIKELEEVLELLNTKQYTKLRQYLAELNDADIAGLLEELEEEDMLKVFRILPKDLAADVFSYLDMDNQQKIITSLSDKEATNIINNLMADDAADLLEEHQPRQPQDHKGLVTSHGDPQKDCRRQDLSHCQASQFLPDTGSFLHFPGTALPFPDTAQADATAQIADGDTVMQEISKDFTDQGTGEKDGTEESIACRRNLLSQYRIKQCRPDDRCQHQYHNCRKIRHEGNKLCQRYHLIQQKQNPPPHNGDQSFFKII